MKPIIKVENLSKQYRLGTIGTGTIREDVQRWWHRVRGKEDPYLKIGEINERSSKGNSEYVWALKDVNFDVMPGEVMGIIGKNGAGKSTLLKILSKVTGPTTGRISYNGRIGSLLEVGTGFHPDLTGRENIFLNGAILGMSKREIRSKFDEIVDFSGCERYIDTPVKRYSSGMTVRLGFAIAAHLDPEILVVDEVLAVGDAEFQRKAIGKMHEVSRDEGRTVLFVSHNMAAIRSMCSHLVVLEKATVIFNGKTNEGITYYLNSANRLESGKIIDKISWKVSDIEINSIEVNGSGLDLVQLASGQSAFTVKISGELASDRRMSLAVCINDDEENRIATYDPAFINGGTPLVKKGHFEIVEKITLPKYVNKGNYAVDIFLIYQGVEYIIKAYKCIRIQIEGYTTASGKVMDSRLGGFLHLE
jgi:lipopolysaccharide transport system ATP-binding protein